MTLAWLFPLLGYLCGSIASAIIVCRLMGLPDPRFGGSKNPGATNVLRLGGKKAATATLLGDVLKGVVPVLAAHALGLDEPVRALTALAAFLGHLFPVFFGFNGGKGVATAIGAIMALAWPVGVAFGLTWLAVATITRYSSAASLAGAAVSPLAALAAGEPLSYAVVLSVMAVFILLRHRENIARLIEGREGRIGEKKTGH